MSTSVFNVVNLVLPYLCCSIDTGFVGQNHQRRKREVLEVGHEVGGGPGAPTATPPHSLQGKERGLLLDHKYNVLCDLWKQQYNKLFILVKVKLMAY